MLVLMDRLDAPLPTLGGGGALGGGTVLPLPLAGAGVGGREGEVGVGLGVVVLGEGEKEGERMNSTEDLSSMSKRASGGVTELLFVRTIVSQSYLTVPKVCCTMKDRPAFGVAPAPVPIPPPPPP